MNYVLLHSYPNYIEAHIARAALDNAGIPCWLKDEHTVTIDPILTQAIGGIKLMVPDHLAEEAFRLLFELQQQNKKENYCPACGSENTEYVSTPRKPMNWISALSTFIMGDYAIATEKMMHCFDCGHEFKLRQDEKN